MLLLALLIWRLMERSMRTHVATTGTTLIGWDRQETDRPTAFMMVTKFSVIIALKGGQQRQLAQSLSMVQRQYLMARGVAAACFTTPNSGEGDRDGSSRRVMAPETYPALAGRGSPGGPTG